MPVNEYRGERENAIQSAQPQLPQSQSSGVGPSPANLMIDEHDAAYEHQTHPVGIRKTITPFTILFVLLQGMLISLYWVCTTYDSIFNPATGVGVSNDVSTFYFFYVDVSFMLYFGFGFLMAFLRKYPHCTYTRVTFDRPVEWAIITVGFARKIAASQSGDIRISIISLIDADYAAAAVLISYGAIIGKVTPVQLLFVALWEILYSVNFYVGSLVLKGVDIGGSIFIHLFGASFGLASSVFLSSSAAKEHPDKTSTYNSDIFAMIGTLFLWILWPSFNAALAPDTTQARVVINTVLALLSSCMASYFFSYVFRGHNKFDMVDIQNATLAGGVTVGSSADLVIEPGGAITIGIAAGLLSTFGFVYISPFLERRFGLQDTCGVLNLHGMTGFIAGVGGAIAVATSSPTKQGVPISDFFPHGSAQPGYQFIIIAITLGIAIVGGLLVGFVTSDHIDWGVPFDYATRITYLEISTVQSGAVVPAV